MVAPRSSSEPSAGTEVLTIPITGAVATRGDAESEPGGVSAESADPVLVMAVPLARGEFTVTWKVIVLNELGPRLGSALFPYTALFRSTGVPFTVADPAT